MIVVLAEVSENQCRHSAIEIVANKIRDHFIRQVPSPAHDSLLHRPGIRPVFQHPEIVIRFEQQQIHAAQMHLDGIRHVAKIRYDANANTFGGDGIADWVNGIVRDREARNLELAYGKPAAGLKAFQPRRDFAPIDRRRSSMREIDRNMELLRKRNQAADMVAMLMSDQDAVELFNALANRGQPLRDLSPAQARIDKYTSLAGGDKCRIA